MEVLEGDEKEQDIENTLEKIMKENFLNMTKEIGIPVLEAHRAPKKMYPKRTTSRDIIIKMQKVKDKERT